MDRTLIGGPFEADSRSCGSHRRVEVGLPVSQPAALLDWARRADAGPFSTLGLLPEQVERPADVL